VVVVVVVVEEEEAGTVGKEPWSWRWS